MMVGLAILAIFAVPLVVSIRRSTELFVVDVRKGRAFLRRGRIPQRLLNDLGDVVKRARVVSGTLRCVVEQGRPRLYPSGQLEAGTIQQLRNVVGTYDVAKIRAGKRPQET